MFLQAAVPQDGVFFAGERFSCTITFTYKGDPGSTLNAVPAEERSVKYGNLLNGMTRTLSLSGEFSPQLETIRRDSHSRPDPPEEMKPPLPPPKIETPTETPTTPKIEKVLESGKVMLSQGNTTQRVLHRQSTFGPDFIPDDDTSSNTPLSINTTVTKGKTQSIAWCFAQIVGQFVVDGNYIKTSQFEPLLQKIMYKIPGGRGAGGGGSMSSNITHHENSAKPSPNALPLYNTPPTILFCDEELEVGESKSFVYEIILPTVLPPSHRGKIIKFQYKLLIGIQKSVHSKTTQMVSIPFRFLNRTNPDGSRPVYEIMNPVIHIKDQAKVSVLDPNMQHMPSPFQMSPTITTMDSSSSLNSKLELEVPTTSIENITNTLQQAGKVSYDICKNNEHIAQLTLPRLGYKLGENVVAVLHFAKSCIPCYHVSVYLETHELVDSVYAQKTKTHIANHTRVCYGEFHQHTVNSKRTTVTLSIPPNATPDFQSTAVSVQWTLRFEFITGTNAQVLYNTSNMSGFVHNRGLAKVSVEPFDCVIPLKVYGALKTTNEQKKALEFEIK